MSEVVQSVRRIAIVTQGYSLGGGVPTVARWLRGMLESSRRYSVIVHDLATSARDPNSRRLLRPRSWARPSLQDGSPFDSRVICWGANAVEIEAMRYRPRIELTRALEEYDVIQVVSGWPALAAAVTRTRVPTTLLAATRVAWDRERILKEEAGLRLGWRRAMTSLTARAERRALVRVDAVMVMNSTMLEYVRASGQERVVKAPPGVDTFLFSPPTSGWQRDGYLLSVCRLSDPRKGLGRMIHAYKYMVQRKGSIPSLILAGAGLPSHSLLLTIADLGLTAQISIRSNVAPGELADLYRGASVYLQTSYEEGLGMSVLEAMACGLPGVCTDTAGTRETVVSGVCGWRVSQAVEAAVPRLVGECVIDVLYGDGARMGARARQRCEHFFSNSVVFERYTSLYDELIQHRT